MENRFTSFTASRPRAASLTLQMVPENTSEHVTPQRDERGRWVRGFCPNKGGRPARVGEVREAASKHSLQAIAVLATEMRSKDPIVRITAAKAILDRAIGRPEQAMTLAPAPSPYEGEPIASASDAARIYAEIVSGQLDAASVTFELPAIAHQSEPVVDTSPQPTPATAPAAINVEPYQTSAPESIVPSASASPTVQGPVPDQPVAQQTHPLNRALIDNRAAAEAERQRKIAEKRAALEREHEVARAALRERERRQAAEDAL